MTLSNRSDSLGICREWNKIVEFYSGRLPESELESIANHVSTCPVCETGLKSLRISLAEDDFAKRIRDSVHGRRRR